MSALDDRLAINRIGDRLPARARSSSGFFLLLIAEDRLALAAADQHLEARIALELARAPGHSPKRGNASTSPASIAATAAEGSEMKRKVAWAQWYLRSVTKAVPLVEGDRGALGPV